MIRAVLFDLDDTLVDCRPTNPRAVFADGAERCYASLSALECSLPSFETFFRQQRAITKRIDCITWLTGREPDHRRYLRRICRDYKLQRGDSSLARLGWLWYESIAENATVAPDVIPTLAALQDGDVKLGLVVNTPFQGAVIDRHLETLGLADFFPVRVYSSEIGRHKPHPKPFTAALDELGTSTAQTLFVGNDLKADILGARRLGMQTVLRCIKPTRRAKRLADNVIAQIGELRDLFDVIPTEPRATSPLPPLHVSAAAGSK